ncbi:MAG: tetratricopeptide repeat protein [Verrucomicrobia bacterium]|nr:tetratricopeptide repeat protein [Verrucomicrobiota bacterium]
MKTTLIGFTRRRPGFGLPTGIALAMLALVVIPIGVAADPSLPTSSDKSESRDDKSSPSSQFLTAYNSMALADWLKEKGMRAEATDLYTEALNLFLKVSADYPQWQPAVVSFRINYCRGVLQNLQKADGVQTPDDGRQPALRSPERSRSGEAGTADGGRRTTEDNLKRTPEDDLSRRSSDFIGTKTEGQATDGRKSEIENRKSEISNLSPLNFKLQQAALKERGRDYTGALAMYIALLEEYPREPWALKGACRCCLRLGRMDKARALTRQALTLPLPDADLNLLAALVDCHDGRFQAAIPLLRQSLKQNGACPEAHAALGVALTAIGEMKEAQEEMKRALSLNPKLSDAYYNLARLSLRQKPTDHDTARVHYQNALRHGAAPDPELDALLAE